MGNVYSGSDPKNKLRVREVDGTPNVFPVSTIVVSNGTLTNDGGGQVTITTGGGAGTGTVTSVAVSGGTTGITITGSPITTSGTITLGGTLGLANGGTAIDSSSVADGQLLIGSSVPGDFQLANISSGNLIQILDGPNSIAVECTIQPQPTPAATSADIIAGLQAAGIFI